MTRSLSGVQIEWIVIARSEATKQPSGRVTQPLGCFAALAMTT